MSLLEHILKENINNKFNDKVVKKIISKLNEMGFSITEYKYLASGGTASVYEVNNKILRISKKYSYSEEAEYIYNKLKNKEHPNLVFVYFYELINILEGSYEIIVMEKLTPLDKSPALKKYNIPSITKKRTVDRHTLVMFFANVGDLIFDGRDITIENIIDERDRRIKFNSNFNMLSEDLINEYLNDNNVQNIIKDVNFGHDVITSITYEPMYDVSFDNIMYDQNSGKYKLIDFE